MKRRPELPPLLPAPHSLGGHHHHGKRAGGQDIEERNYG